MGPFKIWNLDQTTGAGYVSWIKYVCMYVCMCIFEYMYRRKDINESLYRLAKNYSNEYVI